MKKKLALFMTMMLLVSMIPISAFAEKTDEFVDIKGGIQNFNARDENSEVSVLVDLRKDVYLDRGIVEINLSNVKTARIKNAVSAKFIEGSKEVATDTTVTFEDKFEGTELLRGGNDLFVMRIDGKDLRYKGEENVKLMITMNLDFSDSKIGDVDMTLKDVSNTGVGNRTFTIAEFGGVAQRSMQVDIKDEKAQIGEKGGNLSEIKITRFDTLDSVKSNNEIKITLPENLKFTSDTVIKVDGSSITPSFAQKGRQLLVYGVSSQSKELTITPYVDIEGDKVPYGKVNVNIEFMVNKRSVDEKEVLIGLVTDSAAKIVVVEKGKTRMPKMTAGETKTVEVTLNGVKGSFPKGSTIDFKLNGIDVAYHKLTIVEPKAKIMPMGESAGKEARNMVNGLEVYKNRTFTFKILENDMNQIKFEMDITAKMMEDGKAVIMIMKDGVEQHRTEIAEVQSIAKVETNVAMVRKGTEFNANDIIIRETKAGNFEVGDIIYLAFDKENMGFNIKDMKLTATQNVEFSEPKLASNGDVELKVLKKSYNGPARIDITGIKVYTMENVVAGMTKLKINLNEDANTIYEADYVNILGSGINNVTVFTIGNKNYTVSGTSKEASTAPYVKNGYTMLPVRALAESLGLTSNWDNSEKTATFTGSNKIAVVVLGKKEMTVNGTSIPLSVPAEIKNGVTMIELRGLANAFNVQIDWNGTQKTATVMSK